MKNRHIVLGVTGSIAVYKAADLTSRLVKEGYIVDVIMSKAAQEFVQPLTFQALTHRPVVTEMFTLHSEMAVEHIALAERADVLLLAPATANIIAKLRHGFADDMLSCTALATRAPIVIAPAMNNGMYENPVTAENIAVLKARGVTFVGPSEGYLACGTVGRGRLTEILDIFDAVKMVLGRKGDLAGKRVAVTAGGTEEPIDPVRCITNRSSGKMGYALAEAARDRGAEVHLVAGPTSLRTPWGLRFSAVRTANEMLTAVQAAARDCDALLMAAAVSDYRVEEVAEQKIKKSASALSLKLVKNPDILQSLSGDFVKIGFAAESQDLVANAEAKLITKGLHMIVANDISRQGSGFGTDTNEAMLLFRDGRREALPLMTKECLAHIILDRLTDLI